MMETFMLQQPRLFLTLKFQEYSRRKIQKNRRTGILVFFTSGWVKIKISIIFISHSSDPGDRLGDNILHMYWRDFPQGPGNAPSVFRKMKFEIFETQQNP